MEGIKRGMEEREKRYKKDKKRREDLRGEGKNRMKDGGKKGRKYFGGKIY